MNATTTLHELLDALLTPGLHHAEKLRIEEQSDGPFRVFQVTVDRRDMGHIIGKRGSNLEALRILMAIAGTAQEAAVRIVVPEAPDHLPAVRPTTPWSIAAVKAGLAAFFEAAGLHIAATITTRPDRPGQATVFLTAKPPEDVEAALERWLNVMGSPGHTRMLLDDTDPV